MHTFVRLAILHLVLVSNLALGSSLALILGIWFARKHEEIGFLGGWGLQAAGYPKGIDLHNLLLHLWKQTLSVPAFSVPFSILAFHELMDLGHANCRFCFTLFSIPLLLSSYLCVSIMNVPHIGLLHTLAYN